MGKIRIRTEKEYLVKIVDYKGNIIASIKTPKDKKNSEKLLIAIVRLYERALKNGFLTKNLKELILKVINIYLDTRIAITFLAKNPAFLRNLNEIKKELENSEHYEEEIRYEKERKRENKKCSICSVPLVEPAYILFKKGNTVIKVSKPIGIKCLNSLYGRLTNVIQEMYLNFKLLEKEQNLVKTENSNITQDVLYEKTDNTSHKEEKGNNLFCEKVDDITYKTETNNNDLIEKPFFTESSITSDQLMPKSQTETETKAEIEIKEGIKIEPETELETELETKLETKTKTEPKIEPKLEIKPETEPEIKLKTEPEIKPKTELETELKTEPEIKLETEPETKSPPTETKTETEFKPKTEPEIEIKIDNVTNLQTQNQNITIQNIIFVQQEKKITKIIDFRQLTLF